MATKGRPGAQPRCKQTDEELHAIADLIDHKSKKLIECVTLYGFESRYHLTYHLKRIGRRGPKKQTTRKGEPQAAYPQITNAIKANTNLLTKKWSEMFSAGGLR